MKKLMTLMLGMGLALGSVAMYAQAPKADTTKKAAKKSTATKAPKAKATKAAPTSKSKKKDTSK